MIDTIYNEAFTGKVSDREQFNELIKAIEKNEIKTLILNWNQCKWLVSKIDYASMQDLKLYKAI